MIWIVVQGRDGVFWPQPRVGGHQPPSARARLRWRCHVSRQRLDLVEQWMLRQVTALQLRGSIMTVAFAYAAAKSVVSNLAPIGVAIAGILSAPSFSTHEAIEVLREAHELVAPTLG